MGKEKIVVVHLIYITRVEIETFDSGKTLLVMSNKPP